MELNKIYCEDCLETMSRMEDDFIDLTVTSPPYDNLRTYNDNIDETWNKTVWKPIIKELYRITKDGGVVVWVVGDATINGSETGASFQQALYAMKCGFNLHDTMIWNKNQFSAVGALSVRYAPVFEYMFVFTKGNIKTFNAIKDKLNSSYGSIISGGIRQSDGSIKEKSTKGNKIAKHGQRYNIWEVTPHRQSGEDVHPAPFSEDIARDHIRSWSNEGDLVYDPFMGSGTTAKMAHLLKRDWIGSELSQEYVDLAYKRLEKYLTQGMLF